MRHPERHRRTDPQQPTRPRAPRRHGLFRIFHLAEDAPRALIKLLPEFGHGQLARIADQQLHAKPFLQRHHAPADELLGQRQPLCRRGEVMSVDRGDEDPHVIELHRIVHLIETLFPIYTRL
ncbi:hypothetical protein KCU90_g988, partial [Aureobasidium melanogenum]